MATNWFKALFGFQEGRIIRMADIQSQFQLSADHTILTSYANQRSFQIGRFSTPTIAMLRKNLKATIHQFPEKVAADSFSRPRVEIQHIPIAGAREMHIEKPNAVFQAASQFNCLEFPSYNVLPEHGITAYERDPTQGPACAIACGAGTLYRNYFVPVPGSPEPGQSKDYQLNTLDELETYLSNHERMFFYVKNGYTFSSPEQLEQLNQHFRSFSSDDDWDECRKRIKVGLHEDVGVTFDESGKVVSAEREEVRVTQIYCSAISCAYSGVATDLWEPLAGLVLEAMYEGTLIAAAMNMLKKEMTSEEKPSHHDEVFLTFVGGGVFGNRQEWIADAIGRAVALVEKEMSQHSMKTRGGDPLTLKVKVCHFRRVNTEMQSLIDQAYRSHAGL